MLRRNLKLKTLIIGTVAGWVILAGLLVGAVRLVDVALPGYRHEVANAVSQRIDRPVEIGAMDLRWSWQGPVLHLNQASIFDTTGSNPVIRLEKLALHFSVWDLLHARFQPQGVSLVGAQLSAYRDASGKLRLRGIEPGENELDWQEIAEKLNGFQFIQISNGELFWSPTPAPTNRFRLHDIALSLNNQGPRHRLQAQLQLPPELGESMQFEALLIDPTDDDGVDLDNLRAHNYFKGQQLDFTALAKASGEDFQAPDTGRNNLEIWSDWQASEFTGARVSVTGAPQPNKEISGRLLGPEVGLDLSVAPIAQGYRITVDAMRGPDGYQPEIAGDIVINPEEKSAQAELRSLPASLLGSLLPLLDENARWQPAGTLARIQITYNGQATPAEISGNIEFANLSLDNPDRGLQVNGLYGTLELTRDSGQLQLRVADGSLVWRGFIKGELPLETLAGNINWSHGDSGWNINAEQLRWRGAETQVSASGEINIPPEATPNVDIKAQVLSQDLPRLFAYIPQYPELPNPRLRDWLPEAVRTGKMTEGKVTLQGPLDRFPYATGGGKFEVSAKIEQATLDYKPGWPVLTEGNGKFTLIGDTLSVQAEHGKMLGVDIGPASARVADVREPILKIDGSVSNADASQLLDFLPNSPLNEKFGRLTKILEVNGQADLALDLSIPLKPELGEVVSNGRITLQDTTLSHRVLPEPIENINGELQFSREGLSATGLRGNLLGLPLVADLNPAEGSGLSINASTLIRMPRDFDALRRFMPAPIVRQIGGEGVWHAVLEVDRDGKVSDLALRSDLEGISLGFPPPLHKQPSGPLPIRVEIGGGRERVHVDLADRLDLILRSPNGQVSSMDFIFDDTGETAPAGDGIWLGGNIVTLDLLAWQDFLGTLGDDNPGEGADTSKPPLSLRGADLRIQETLVGGQRMNRVQFKFMPVAGSSGWRADIAGPGALGNVRYLPAPSGTPGARTLLNAQFERMEFEPDANLRPQNDELSEPEKDAPPRDPGKLPVTDIAVENITLDGINIGRLDLQARAIPGGIGLNRLAISGGKLSVDAHGQWLRKNGLTEASLEANIKGAGMGSLLRTLGYVPNIRAEDTDIQAKLNIAPNPDGLSLAALNGLMEVKFDDGTLVSVDPGAGRVLGLFNFYALPRRLLLDFRDVVDKGLAFDSIRGDFQIESGVARSDDLRIRTPSASVRVKGTVDLAERTYDQRVTIVPKVSTGVAVAGTVLGGPAVGAFLLLAQKLLEKPIEDLSTIKYHLTGNWQDPEINTITTEEATEDTP